MFQDYLRKATLKISFLYKQIACHMPSNSHNGKKSCKFLKINKDFQAQKAVVITQQSGPKPTIDNSRILSDTWDCLSNIRNLSERFWLLSKEVLNFQREVIQLRGGKRKLWSSLTNLTLYCQSYVKITSLSEERESVTGMLSVIPNGQNWCRKKHNRLCICRISLKCWCWTSKEK